MRSVIRAVAAIGVILPAISPGARAGTVLVYEVSFEEGSCAIGPDGSKEIAEFVSDTNNYAPGVNVVLVARAADEGSDDEMMRLARCRGEAVKAEVVRDGLTHSAIKLDIQGGPDYWRRRDPGWSVAHDRTVIMYRDQW